MPSTKFTNVSFRMSGDQRKVKFAVALGTAPLRKWEQLVIARARAVIGVEFIGFVRSSADELSGVSFGGRLFHRCVQTAKGSEMLAIEPQTEDGPGADAPMPTTLSPDVLLFLGGSIPTKAQMQATACWCFQSPDGVASAHIPPGTREALTDRSITHFELVDRSTSAALRSGAFPTHPGLPILTAEHVLEHAANWPALALQELVSRGAVHSGPTAVRTQEIPVPGNISMALHHLARLLTRAAPNTDERQAGDWNIGLLHQPIHVLLDEDASMNVRWFPPPSSSKGRMEPFGYFAADGELNVLYHKADGNTGGNSIARLRPKPDNILKRSRVMLEVERDHAYPYVVLVNGVPHVLRTVRSEGSTGLYRVNDTNDGLDPVAVLLDVALHSPTLFEHDGRWWLMGTQDPLRDAALFAYHGASPTGPFTPHLFNPVKCDVRSARPAGTPFAHEGVLWRPALDVSDPQRPAVVLNKVLSLSPDTFAEEPGRMLEGFTSTAYGRGVRTLCAMGEVTLVDGLRSPVLSASKANAGRSKRRKRSKPSEEE